MKRAIGYTRVSTFDQADKGISLDAQREQIIRYCKLHDLELVDIIVDGGISGGIPINERPGGHSLLEAIDSKSVNNVVAVKLDRVFRSTTNALFTIEAWNKQGVGFHVIDLGGDQSLNTGSAMGQFVITVMAALGQLEREQTGERIRSAHDHKARQGEWHGGTPPLGYVYDADKNVVINEDQAALVRRIFELRVSGLGTHTIARQLNDDGCATQQGKRFEHGTIHKVLHRYTYICKREHKGDIFDLHVPRLLDDETWAKVQEMSKKHLTGVK